MRGVLYGLAGAAAWSAPAPAAVVPAFARPFGIRLRLPHDRGVALTFDDGPHPQGTPAVLELLASRDAKATFFLVGEQVDRFPSLAAEIASAGHEVAVHGYRHRLLLRRSPSGFAADLDRAVAAIGEATGRAPAVYRPPYGIFSLPALAVVRRRRLTPLLWTRWGKDWRPDATGPSISALACASLAPGDVVVLHDADHYSSPGAWRNTAAALPSILDAVAALGVGCCAVTHST
ncbi:MAG TPA: polysaccharide deacetylase family protein [Gaiellaceae bacterium]|nr:polysaccharide deacetylase family protein [Gaiellaceae bacterium]